MSESRREVPRINKDGSVAKKPWVQRQCEVCLDWFSTTKIAIDHCIPVVSVDTGFVDWNQFIERLWSPKENLQRICTECHKKKTANERFERMLKSEWTELRKCEEEDTQPQNKEFLKKFTPGRLKKFEYPQDFIDRILIQRKRFGLRIFNK